MSIIQKGWKNGKLVVDVFFSSQSERMTLLFVLCCSEEEDWYCNTDHQLRRRKRKVGTGNKRGRGLCRKLFFKGEVMGIPAGIEKIQKKKIQKKEK